MFFLNVVSKIAITLSYSHCSVDRAFSYGLTSIPAWMSNHMLNKCGMKLLIHSQISTAAPRWSFAPHSTTSTKVYSGAWPMWHFHRFIVGVCPKNYTVSALLFCWGFVVWHWSSAPIHEQTIETPVIWDTIALIMTPLQWFFLVNAMALELPQ